MKCMLNRVSIIPKLNGIRKIYDSNHEKVENRYVKKYKFINNLSV